jgi:hypothetical protein
LSQIDFILPLDQPLGNRRLLRELRTALRDPAFNSLNIIVAYAKSGPLLRLKTEFEQWRVAGKRVDAIFGIDQQGTSHQAIDFALALFANVYVTQERGITFHPKLYLFEGPSSVKLFIGSNNLTVGGTETNFETAVEISCVLPADDADLAPVRAAWAALLPSACPATRKVDAALVAALAADGTLPDEAAMATRTGAGTAGAGSRALKSGLSIQPASPLPRTIMERAAAAARAASLAAQAAPAPVPLVAVQAAAPVRAQRFAIQIKPHDNGEIFLSVTAALQNPPFFKWPFNGWTVPKRAGNPSYPQLVPDPIVNLEVWGSGIIPVFRRDKYSLNTVYYRRKSEIRITAAPLVPWVPDYSVMVMELSSAQGIDYDIAIYRPDSPDYQRWVDACNQTMPGGGKTPRKFGWF